MKKLIIMLFISILLAGCDFGGTPNIPEDDEPTVLYLPVFANTEQASRAIIDGNEETMGMLRYYLTACPITSFSAEPVNENTKELTIDFLGFPLLFNVTFTSEGKQVFTGSNGDQSIWAEVIYDPESESFEYRHYTFLSVPEQASIYAIVTSKEPVTIDENGAYSCIIDAVLYESNPSLPPYERIARGLGESYSSKDLVGALFFARYNKPDSEDCKIKMGELVSQIEEEENISKLSMDILENMDEYFPIDTANPFDKDSSAKNLHYGINSESGFVYGTYDAEGSITKAQDIVDVAANGKFKNKWILQNQFEY